MRIISGIFKGVSLHGPNNKKIRPLKDMVRESIFNFLTHSNKILFSLEKSNVLDLYSGTGSFGIECLSRKASKVVFVEREKEALKILQKNIEKIKGENKSKVLPNDIFYAIDKKKIHFAELLPNLKFDIIFCDPPFKNSNLNDLIELIIERNILKKSGIIILHRHKNTKEKLSLNFKIIDERTYGLSKIIFGEPLSFAS